MRKHYPFNVSIISLYNRILLKNSKILFLLIFFLFHFAKAQNSSATQENMVVFSGATVISIFDDNINSEGYGDIELIVGKEKPVIEKKLATNDRKKIEKSLPKKSETDKSTKFINKKLSVKLVKVFTAEQEKAIAKRFSYKINEAFFTSFNLPFGYLEHSNISQNQFFVQESIADISKRLEIFYLQKIYSYIRNHRLNGFYNQLLGRAPPSLVS